MRAFAIAVVVLASRAAFADLANNEAIHAHVDSMLMHVDLASLDASRRDALMADRLTLNLGAWVPILGTYKLDHEVFGGVRPAAVVFDWILGGVAPVTLGTIALADGSLSAHTRATLGWTAVGLYASTRLGILIVGNLHISEYNRYLRLRLGIAESPSRQLVPAVVASTTW